MLENVTRYDMKSPPMRQHLRTLIRVLSAPDLLSHSNVLTKTGMEGVEPPYLLLCNHNAFMDFKVASKAMYPHRANFVVAIDGFVHREFLLRLIGCICTRKFTSDMMLVQHMREVIEAGDIAVLYPEARYSLCGTTAVLPDSLGKLAVLLGVPVVTLICHGHHVNSPFYHLPDHGVRPTDAQMRCIVSAEEIRSLSADEVNERIRKAFRYDDFRWQKEKGVRITYPKRAEGLHKVLYQCAACGTEYRMASEGTRLSCRACGKSWELSELGELSGTDGITEFSHVPDWYEWERANVRREVEEGTYRFRGRVRVDALPNAEGYIDLGQAVLTHDSSGFLVEGAYPRAIEDAAAGKRVDYAAGSKAAARKGPLRNRKLGRAAAQPVRGNGDTVSYRVHIPVPQIYSCHIEYEYLGTYGDCIDLNTREDTMYIYPEGEDFAVTKFALATEELYAAYQRQQASRRQDLKSSRRQT